MVLPAPFGPTRRQVDPGGNETFISWTTGGRFAKGRPSERERDKGKVREEGGVYFMVLLH